MADERDAGIAIDQVRAIVQVGLADDVELIAFRFRPHNEVALEAGPARRHVFLGIAIGIGPFHVRVARLGIDRRIVEQHGARRIRRQRDEPPGQRTQRAEDGRKTIAQGAAIALVMVRAAPVIVGRPRCGRGDEQQAAPSPGTFARANDEDVLMHVVACACAQDVAARGPVHLNGYLERHRPATARDRAVIRRVAPVAGQGLLREHRGRRQSVADDLDIIARGVGADADLHSFARRIGEPVAVAPDAEVGGRSMMGPLGVIAEHGLAPPRVIAIPAGAHLSSSAMAWNIA